MKVSSSFIFVSEIIVFCLFLTEVNFAIKSSVFNIKIMFHLSCKYVERVLQKIPKMSLFVCSQQCSIFYMETAIALYCQQFQIKDFVHNQRTHAPILYIGIWLRECFIQNAKLDKLGPYLHIHYCADSHDLQAYAFYLSNLHNCQNNLK